MSVSDLFELAVRKLIDMKPVRQLVNVFEIAEYEDFLNFMDAITSDSGQVSVPADEDGCDARIEKYHVNFMSKHYN